MLKKTLQPYLQKLISRGITGRVVAKELGISEEHLSRTLKGMGIAREPAQKRKQKEATSKRREQIEALAKTMPAAEAAKQANCSIRTIYRYRS